MRSGTTLIAAETTGRVRLGIDLNPAYVEVAVDRWERFLGGTATLDGDSRSFTTLMGQRAGAAAQEVTAWSKG